MKKRTRKRKNLEVWLNASTTPVFLLNASRQIVFFSFGCEQLTGWTADEIVGQASNYDSRSDGPAMEALANSLCPPPEVWAGQELRLPVYLTLRKGESAARLLNYFPLKDEQGQVKSVLGVIEPIRQPQQRIAVSPAHQLHAELAALRLNLRQRFGIKTLVCRSEPMVRALAQIQLARNSQESVFLQGEQGTGKEHIARLIHYESAARGRAFVPLDCRKLPAWELIQTFRRLFETPPEDDGGVPSLQPGTVYLQDVEHMPRDAQERLVAAYREKSSQEAARLRLMSSSTGSLQQAVESDAVRADLFYLLTTLSIELPPLRRRIDDLPPLAQHFLEGLNRGAEKQIGGFAEDVWEQFRKYNWPGNLDELTTIVAEARAACTNTVIGLGDLPFRFRTGLDAQAVGPRIEPQAVPLDPLLLQVETEQIQLALKQSRNNKSKAAELLGINRQRLHRRMQILGIEDREEAAGDDNP
jgi:DNA-binding NtrC family response regulator